MILEWQIGDLSGKKGILCLIMFQLRVKAGVIDLSDGYGNGKNVLSSAVKNIFLS
jgi:hypothetical protein